MITYKGSGTYLFEPPPCTQEEAEQRECEAIQEIDDILEEMGRGDGHTQIIRKNPIHR